eukprot:755508-Hanusia_phi.AAC.5
MDWSGLIRWDSPNRNISRSRHLLLQLRCKALPTTLFLLTGLPGVGGRCVSYIDTGTWTCYQRGTWAHGITTGGFQFV